MKLPITLIVSILTLVLGFAKLWTPSQGQTIQSNITNIYITPQCQTDKLSISDILKIDQAKIGKAPLGQAC